MERGQYLVENAAIYGHFSVFLVVRHSSLKCDKVEKADTTEFSI